VTTAHDTGTVLSGAFQDIPVRLFPVMLLAAVGLEELVRVRQGKARSGVLVALGCLAGLVAWNNHDFGVEGAAVFSLLVLVVATPRFARRSPVWSYLIGLLLGLLVYPVWMAAIGAPVSFTYVIYFQRFFEQGYAAFPVQVPGPVLVIMPLTIGTAAVGWYFVWTRMLRRKAPPRSNGFLDRAALTAAFFGTWSSIAFTYYLDRSYSAGQLQTFLLPSAVSIAAVVALVGEFVSERRSSRQGSSLTNVRRSFFSTVRAGALPVALLGALSFAAILETENPVQAVRVLTSPPASTNLAFPSTTGVAVEARFAAKDRESVGYFGSWGPYVELTTGVKSFATFDDAGGETSPTSGTCVRLRQSGPHLLVADPTTEAGYGTQICGDLYILSTQRQATPYFIYLRAGPARDNTAS